MDNSYASMMEYNRSQGAKILELSTSTESEKQTFTLYEIQDIPGNIELAMSRIMLTPHGKIRTNRGGAVELNGADIRQLIQMLEAALTSTTPTK